MTTHFHSTRQILIRPQCRHPVRKRRRSELLELSPVTSYTLSQSSQVGSSKAGSLGARTRLNVIERFCSRKGTSISSILHMCTPALQAILHMYACSIESHSIACQSCTSKRCTSTYMKTQKVCTLVSTSQQSQRERPNHAVVYCHIKSHRIAVAAATIPNTALCKLVVTVSAEKSLC